MTYWLLPAAVDRLCDRFGADEIAFPADDIATRGEAITYGRLAVLSMHFAGLLAQLGVRPADRVAILDEADWRQAAVIIGIWRVGAIHVPLERTGKRSELERRIAAGGGRLIVAEVTDRGLISHIDGVAIIEIDAGFESRVALHPRVTSRDERLDPVAMAKPTDRGGRDEQVVPGFATDSFGAYAAWVAGLSDARALDESKSFISF